MPYSDGRLAKQLTQHICVETHDSLAVSPGFKMSMVHLLKETGGIKFYNRGTKSECSHDLVNDGIWPWLLCVRVVWKLSDLVLVLIHNSDSLFRKGNSHCDSYYHLFSVLETTTMVTEGFHI